MEEVVCENTLELIKKEKERYNRLLKYLESAYCANSKDENLRYLINLKDGEFTSRINLSKTEFILKSYKLDKDVLLYDYLAKFLVSDEFYRALVLTSKNVTVDNSNFSLLDNKVDIS